MKKLWNSHHFFFTLLFRSQSMILSSPKVSRKDLLEELENQQPFDLKNKMRRKRRKLKIPQERHLSPAM
jgi:hypothetical protein